MKKNKASIPYHELIVNRLRGNTSAQVDFIRDSLEENADMPQTILTAIRLVAEARGFKNFANEAGVNRESLYKTLSEDGNPKLDTLAKILDVLDLRLTVEAKPRKVG